MRSTQKPAKTGAKPCQNHAKTLGISYFPSIFSAESLTACLHVLAPLHRLGPRLGVALTVRAGLQGTSQRLEDFGSEGGVARDRHQNAISGRER